MDIVGNFDWKHQINNKLQDKFKNMSESCQVQQDNISIEIDPAIFDKPDSQLTQQLYEMARRIAESDRNNEAYRQAKKSKSLELETLKHSKRQLQSQLERLETQISTKKVQQTQNTFSKNNRIKFQQINTMCEDLAVREKEVQKNTCEILKQNEKLEKKLAVLQVQYEIMLKQNKYKSNVAAKLAKQKEEKLEMIRQNQDKIIQLENQCESTKKRAEDLESQLKEELKNEQELQELIKERELELETQRKHREETHRKQEQSKKVLMKMVNSAKSLENEIENKFRQGQKLQSIHESLHQKILSMQSQQKKLEEFMSNRKNILGNLKQISSRASREQQSLNSLKASKQKQSQ